MYTTLLNFLHYTLLPIISIHLYSCFKSLFRSAVPRGPIEHPVIDFFTKKQTGTIKLNRDIFGAPLRYFFLLFIIFSSPPIFLYLTRAAGLTFYNVLLSGSLTNDDRARTKVRRAQRCAEEARNHGARRARVARVLGRAVRRIGAVVVRCSRLRPARMQPVYQLKSVRIP
jgi:hypothetical protein